MEFSYYGRMNLPGNFDFTKNGVCNFMLEEMVVTSFERVQNILLTEIKSEINRLRKDIENEIRKQNESIKSLTQFKKNLEEELKKQDKIKTEERDKLAEKLRKEAENPKIGKKKKTKVKDE